MIEISVQLLGPLRIYLPSNREFDQLDYRLEDDQRSLCLFLESLAIPESEPYQVILNERLLDDRQVGTRQLADGDKLVVFPPLKGG